MSRTRRTRAALAAGVVAAAAALAGCGVGAGDEARSGVALTVTRDYGARTLLAEPAPEIAASDTVMRFLQRNADVRTRFGGGFVQSIDGTEGGRRDGRPVDWFFYVNGIEAAEGASAIEVNDGDRVWWDHHDWGTVARVPAVVGSFPEPFVSGIDGKRRAVRVECDEDAEAACSAVVTRLTGLGIPAARGRLGTPAEEALRVLVGRFSELREIEEPARLDEGPQASGVFARFSDDGRRLTVLDPRGRPARELGAGTGLVAATSVGTRAPLWLVTGTDDAGVRSAARAFEETALADRFALAIADDLPVSVPLVAPGEEPEP